VIEVRGLTKRYGSTVAVDRLSFDVLPGAVTGFLGLNGSGKSTTMRMILGLDARTPGTPESAARPTAGFAGRCARPEDCWNPGPSTRAGLPTRTWPRWRPATPSASPGSPRSWR
jgi:energy-coupling factor transporter ATP-binding protein EcfA2